MKDNEVEKILEELQEVRPEKLNKKAKRLFEAIMKIADDKDKYYEMINLMADYIGKEDTSEEFCKERYNPTTNDCDTDCRACVIKYFEERCKDAKD